MLKTLLLSRLEAMLSVITGAGRTKKAQGKGKLIGFAALMGMSLFSLGTLFGQIFGSIAQPFHLLGLDWLYYALAATMAFATMLIGNVFLAKAQLYEAKDNDLLLSMPIRPIHILLSRLFLMLVLALLLALPILIPALLFRPAPLGALGGIAFFLTFFLALPLVVLALSALLGWLIHLLAAKARNKSLITVLISLGFMGAYMVFSFRMNSMIAGLTADPSCLERTLGAAAPLVWIGRGIAEERLGGLAIVLAAALALFALCLWLLSRSFIRTATARGSGVKQVYVERSARAHSPRTALLLHELRRLWGTPAYLLNGALGSVFVLVAAVVLLVKGGAITGSPAWPETAHIFRPLGLLGLCFMAAMTFLTAPSISLEGRCLWLPKSLPLTAWEVLQAKLRLHMLIALPPLLIASAVMALVLGYSGAMLILVLLLPAAYGVFSGLLGLFENLRRPNFNWINETQAVKSGASVLLTMFAGMAAAGLPALVFMIFGEHLSLEAVGFGTLGLLLALCALLYLWLRRRGPEVFASL